MTSFEVSTAEVRLAGDDAGRGTPVVLLHGLTATRRHVVMGSQALERSGHRVVAYDARGHGASTAPADPAAYTYDRLAADLLAVLDDRGIARGVLAGASMGAHTALRLVLDSPERVAALVLITPAFSPGGEPPDFGRWDALAHGLRTAGIEGFAAAYGEPRVPQALRKTIATALRQRLAAHEQPEAVADALQAVPRSTVFGAWEELSVIRAPTLVVASRDETDPGHPYEVAQRYARSIPGARLAVEEPGRSPLAWQGGQLSQVIAEHARRA